MARTRFAPDRGLTNRMLLTMFMIGLLYVVVVAALLVFLKGAWLIILLVAGGLFVAQFWFSDRIAAFSMGAARSRGPALRTRRHAEAEGGRRSE
jgi:heat shock protein HtpX